MCGSWPPQTNSVIQINPTGLFALLGVRLEFLEADMISLQDIQKLPSLFGGRVTGQLYYGAWVKVFISNKGDCTVFAFGKETIILSVNQLHQLLRSLIDQKNSTCSV